MPLEGANDEPSAAYTVSPVHVLLVGAGALGSGILSSISDLLNAVSYVQRCAVMPRPNKHACWHCQLNVLPAMALADADCKLPCLKHFTLSLMLAQELWQQLLCPTSKQKSSKSATQFS